MFLKEKDAKHKIQKECREFLKIPRRKAVKYNKEKNNGLVMN